jgi:hypothetical protein
MSRYIYISEKYYGSEEVCVFVYQQINIFFMEYEFVHMSVELFKADHGTLTEQSAGS